MMAHHWKSLHFLFCFHREQCILSKCILIVALHGKTTKQARESMLEGSKSSDLNINVHVLVMRSIHILMHTHDDSICIHERELTWLQYLNDTVIGKNTVQKLKKLPDLDFSKSKVSVI